MDNPRLSPWNFLITNEWLRWDGVIASKFVVWVRMLLRKGGRRIAMIPPGDHSTDAKVSNCLNPFLQIICFFPSYSLVFMSIDGMLTIFYVSTTTQFCKYKPYWVILKWGDSNQGWDTNGS